MFGYVTPYKMELKIKDYEKFRAYYCGLCLEIKKQYGNLPRICLNYDMTFLAILLDSLDSEKNLYKKHFCIFHATSRRIVLYDNKALSYAAFCNLLLTYYKLQDDILDDKSIVATLGSLIFKGCLKKNSDITDKLQAIVKEKLAVLNSLEKNPENESIDSLAHPFAELTAKLITSYFHEDCSYIDNLYHLGYNLGKWIYLIDALDDLEKDMKKNKFNALNAVLNKDNLDYTAFRNEILDRINFTLTTCCRKCLECLTRLPLIKNQDLLFNILQYGTLDKMDRIIKGVKNHEQSL